MPLGVLPSSHHLQVGRAVVAPRLSPRLRLVMYMGAQRPAEAPWVTASSIEGKNPVDIQSQHSTSLQRKLVKKQLPWTSACQLPAFAIWPFQKIVIKYSFSCPVSAALLEIITPFQTAGFQNGHLGPNSNHVYKRELKQKNLEPN